MNNRVRLVVYMTREENQSLENHAEKAGMNRSQYARSKLLGEPVREDSAFRQQTMSYLCHLLKELELGGDNPNIIKEVSELCHLLK